jgi:hypothetical protein
MDPDSLKRLLSVLRRQSHGEVLSFDEDIFLRSASSAAAESRQWSSTSVHFSAGPDPDDPGGGEFSYCISSVRATSLANRAQSAWHQAPDYPRIWGLLQYLLPHKARRDVFHPAHEELRADYYVAMRTYRSKGARACLRFCFGFRTVLMLVECYRVVSLDRLVPPRLRRWLMG